MSFTFELADIRVYWIKNGADLRIKPGNFTGVLAIDHAELTVLVDVTL